MHTSDSRFGSDSVFSTVSWLLEQFSVASSGHCSTASAGIWLLAQFRDLSTERADKSKAVSLFMEQFSVVRWDSPPSSSEVS